MFCLQLLFECSRKALSKLRAVVVFLLTGLKFKRVGTHVKIFGTKQIVIGKDVSIGDFCWIEAVTRYAGRRYRPSLLIGHRVALSDLTHISCVQYIEIGDDCLLGSKIYVGDHHHGSITDIEQIRTVSPSKRPLGDIAPIKIGSNTWIGDGAVILPGTMIGSCSIVGANSVVHLVEHRPALIAGAPAKVIRYLDLGV